VAEARQAQAAFEGPQVEKTRHYLTVAGHRWEVDEFHGNNAGLVVAEIELGDEDETFARPGWLGAEVTGDVRYYNVSLAEQPWQDWAHGTD
jgi:adenylate cyclase